MPTGYATDDTGNLTCNRVGHVWATPMLVGHRGTDVKRVCARCGLHGLGNEPLAKVFIGKIVKVKE